MTRQPSPQALARLCLLDDPTRRALYEHVARQAGPVTRDDAAAAVGVDRAVAAYHLDRLQADGLLTADFARPPGKGGPGAGRPAKRYSRVETELALTFPPRDYRLAAEIFVRAVQGDHSGRVREEMERTAATVGKELAASLEEPAGTVCDPAQRLVAALEQLGFEPYADSDGWRLRNCPFHQLAQRHTELVCGMNASLLSGLAEHIGGRTVEARLDPGEGRCCVALSRVEASTEPASQRRGHAR